MSCNSTESAVCVSGKPAKISKIRIDWEYPPFAWETEEITGIVLYFDFTLIRYAISLSNDATAYAWDKCFWSLASLDDFSEVASSKANPSNATTDGIAERVGRYVRYECHPPTYVSGFHGLNSVSLERPHPRHGKLKTKFIYGIRDVQVFSNKLQSIVQNRVDVLSLTSHLILLILIGNV